MEAYKRLDEGWMGKMYPRYLFTRHTFCTISIIWSVVRSVTKPMVFKHTFLDLFDTCMVCFVYVFSQLCSLLTFLFNIEHVFDNNNKKKIVSNCLFTVDSFYVFLWAIIVALYNSMTWTHSLKVSMCEAECLFFCQTGSRFQCRPSSQLPLCCGLKSKMAAGAV